MANTFNSDLATGLSNTICKDGQSTPTANITMGGFKITNIGAASATGDALSYGRAGNMTTLTLSGALTGTTATLSGSMTAGNSNLLVGSTAILSAGSQNYLLGSVATLSGAISILTWNSGLGFALLFLDAAGLVYLISSSNAAGGNSAFDITNSFASNSGNGVAVIPSGGSYYVQTKTNYSGPTACRLAQIS